MSEVVHRAQQLREAEIEFNVAGQRAAELDKERSLWRKLSPRRFATLCRILSLLKDATRICGEAGTDPRSPLASAIRNLYDKTSRQLRNVLAAYGVILAVALTLAIIAGRESSVMSLHDSPVIVDPKAGDAVDMTISVSGPFPKGSLPPGTNLYLLVKPQGFNYWLQPLPDISLTGWRVEKAGIGDKEEDRGKHFLICALMTQQVLSTGWNAPDLPPGDTHCIDITRK
jgi:hypothetical protein